MASAKVSLERLERAVTKLETVVEKKEKVLSDSQQDLFGGGTSPAKTQPAKQTASNDDMLDKLSQKLDKTIENVELLLKEG